MRIVSRMTAAVAGLAGLLMASAAFADPVELAIDPVDEDGKITLGDLFEGAGSAAGVFVADRAGPTAVLDAGQVQTLAHHDAAQAVGVAPLQA